MVAIAGERTGRRKTSQPASAETAPDRTLAWETIHATSGRMTHTTMLLCSQEATPWWVAVRSQNPVLEMAELEHSSSGAEIVAPPCSSRRTSVPATGNAYGPKTAEMI